MRSKQIKKVIILALAFGLLSPLVAYAATDTDATTINALLGSAISLTTSTTINLNVTPTSGGSQTSAADTVTVATNNETGFNLTLADADTDTDLVKLSDTISAHTGTQGSPTALDNDTWGYRVDDTGGFGSGPTTGLNNVPASAQTFAGVPSSAAPNTLKSTSVTTSGDVTTVWFSTKVTTAKPNGTYSDTVTYTATTNP